MRFEVPQFIEIEDKVIGPLTWKQFIYLAGGVGILVILYLWLPLILFIAFGLPFGILSASLAFHKINNRPFSVFLESILSYFGKAKLYLWRKRETQSIVERTEGKVEPVHTATLSFTSKRSINALSRKLDIQPPKEHG